MSKGAYIGVDGKAKWAKRIYIGVDGKARKIVKAYVGDENGKARLFYETHKITIASEQSSWNAEASVTVEGTNYDSNSGEVSVAEGTIIKCSVTGKYSMGANDSGTGHIFINGEEVATAYGCTKTYDYVVKSNATIYLKTDFGGLGVESGGIITIVEEGYVTLTINGGINDSSSRAYIKIMGVDYGRKIYLGTEGVDYISVCNNHQVAVPIGTTITCTVYAGNGGYDAEVIVNDEKVFSLFNGDYSPVWKSGNHTYTVTQNANIDLYQPTSDKGGVIIITEQ